MGEAELSSRFAALMDVVFDADVVKADLGSAMRGEQSSMWTAEDQFVALLERAEELLTELAAEDAPPVRSTNAPRPLTAPRPISCPRLPAVVSLVKSSS